MAIRVALNHKTHYRYDRPVWLSPHVVRLRPAPHCRTPIVSYSLRATPGEHFINWQQDPYSNRLARLVFPKKAREFGIEIDLVAELTVINPFDFFIDASAEKFPFVYEEQLAKELAPYLEKKAWGSKFNALIDQFRGKEMTTINLLVAINQSIQQSVKYLIRLEPGVQTPDESLKLGCGSCRDSAWLLVQLARQLGLASRFVSGYLIQLAPDVKSLDGPSGTSIDFTDLHAWTEIYIPGAGWVGLDPTSGLLAGEGHIPLACTAEPSTAAAISGFFHADDAEILKADPDDEHEKSDAKDDFIFSMSVQRIHEDPRVTKPYTEEQWAEIEALGHQIDKDLNANDVRLTMGGEPTFVSSDDMESPQWSSEAMGPLKFKLADELARRLREKFSTGGLLHHGQGKWYPGEQLPRWAIGLYWRKDGQPVWKNYDLIADATKQYPVTEQDARHFLQQVAERLGVSPRYAMPGYEDAFYYLWKERRLPVNVDPFDSKLENEGDRKRLAKIFEQGLDKVVGYTLPIRKVYFTDGTSEWESGQWFFRAERMYLIPGDSAMGYRLPLDSIPWVVKTDYPYVYPQDPWAERGPLPDRDALSRQRSVLGAPPPGYPANYVEQTLATDFTRENPGVRPTWNDEEARDTSTTDVDRAARGEGASDIGASGTVGTHDAGDARQAKSHGTGRIHAMHPRSRDRVTSDFVQGLPPATGISAPWIIRTAMCAQVRDGQLRIFMPPVRYLEDYLEVVNAIEDTAAALKLPVLLEGYTPPFDPRLNVMKVTPDPGVIEVNTLPVKSWDELVKSTTILYDEARLTRLGTEKFMLDGKHTGTGGGNHIVIGGTTPADSPLLRRPDLLRSLVAYWHNHPSLSYLFSGMFVGPTSQAPRMDEARNDQVYELEIAFRQIPRGSHVPPWLVDRIFRNLLIDSTGNTHRAEFCIDKMYTPEGGAGRLGLLEMRAFEMPPHARMSLTQHLLLRSLISKFWQEPYEQDLVRWRTEIHDRFMLPYFVQEDLRDVVADLNLFGYPIKTEWFDAHMEFRFPHYGTIEQRGVTVDLRQAIEPWHVLGEDPGPGGTVRYVDSSLERVQVLVNGMVDSRHIVTCNGKRVPLHPTGTNGEFIAGVRYRAWQPPNCLHPTIGVHSPLVFDVVDVWNNRSIGGCTYHVSHPGGRSYDRFPINSYEAESRRINRFFKFGHTPGKVVPPPEVVTKEFPFTLDLRTT